MKKYLFLFPFLSFFVFQAARAESFPRVKIAFSYSKGSTLKMELYNVTDELLFSVSKTGVTRNPDKLPITSPLKDVFDLDKNGEKTFVMIVRNHTDKPKYFTAVPHTVSPPEASIGVIFECLCNHHVYEIPPGTTWYRVVHIELPKDQEEAIKNIKEITLIHQFIEISAKDAEMKYKKIIYDMGDGGRPR